MMNITLKQLNVFVAICHQQSITQAAKTIFMSKAAASMALSELENQLGHKLFDRTNNRLYLNDQGAKLLPLADELLHRTDNITTLFEQSGALTGSLAIGASETIGNQICPWLIAQFRQKTQHTQQQLSIKNSADICDMLLKFQLDIGLIEGDISHPDIEVIPWMKDEMCIICAPNEPLLQKASLSLADLTDREWILRESGSGSRAFFNNHIATAIPSWSMAYQLCAIEAQLNFVAAGLGFACVSKFSATHAIANQRVAILPVGDLPARQYKILLLKNKFKSELVNQFVQFSQEWQPN
jgi:DNA-binding transcriptional LysR family regulator